VYRRTFSFCLNVSGRTVPLILAKVSNIFNASSIRPLASNHLGDSGRNLRRKIKLYVRLYAITSGHATDAHGTREFYNKVIVSMFDHNNEYFNLLTCHQYIKYSVNGVDVANAKYTQLRT